jgi:hypothetical protein
VDSRALEYLMINVVSGAGRLVAGDTGSRSPEAHRGPDSLQLVNHVFFDSPASKGCIGGTLGHLFSTAAAVSFTAQSPRPE